MLHELWVDPDGLDTFCLAGPEGHANRSLLPPNSRLEWTVDAPSHFEAMTQYYRFRYWGIYTTDFPEQDMTPYVDQ